jgi:hypothetical protein
MKSIEIEKELIDLVESKKVGLKLSNLQEYNLKKEFLEGGLSSIIIKSFLNFYYATSSIECEDDKERLDEFLQWVSASSETLENSILILKNNL